MTKTRTKALALMLGAGIALSGICAAFPAVTVDGNALDISTQMTYPFETREEAFRYAPTFTGVSETTQDLHWEFIQVFLDDATADFSKAKYVAIQMQIEQGNPGFTVGIHDASGNRYMTVTNGNKAYFLSEDGTIQEMSMLNTELAFKQGMSGTLLLPMDQLSWQTGAGDLTKINSVYFTHNSQYHAGWKISVGDVGIYEGEPDVTAMRKLVDCSQAERAKSKYYVDSVNPDCMKMPSESGIMEPEPPEIAYPFRKGEGADTWAAVWQGPVNGDSSQNWQTLTVKFDQATVDFSEASYLIIQYHRMGDNAPGITFGLENKGARYSVGAAEADGKPVYFMGENDAASVKAANFNNGAVTAPASNKMSAMIIPMDSMAWQFGDEANRDLTAIDTLVLTTNSQYNYNYRIMIGEIGLYTGEAGSGTFTKLLDLSSDKSDKFAVTSDLEANRGSLSFIDADAVRETMGDATIDIKGEGKTDSSFSEEGGTTGNVLINGSYGSLKVVKDSYDEDAMQLTATGITGDGYTAFTLSDGEDIDWANRKGVSFWARNDSDAEVSFNFEIDCKVASGARSRFNILQGNRYWLYDVNTGKTTIYMTRPTATLPAGFEGWVRIPFSAFERASWSSGVSKEEFMGEGSVVAYLGISVSAASYLNQSFSINNIGAYTTTPQFSSSFVDAGGKTIPELLGLI